MDQNALAQVLISKGGYNPTDAMSAARGPRAAELAREFGVATPGGFDFEAETRKAYGELGDYYGRILKESRGNVTLAISRLVEDYDRGNRVRKEDYDKTVASIMREKEAAKIATRDNALARGIYQKSADDPYGGRGIYDANAQKVEDAATRSMDSTSTALSRAEEEAAISKGRQEKDINKNQEMFEFEKEQERRERAAQLAESRANRALARFNATLI